MKDTMPSKRWKRIGTRCLAIALIAISCFGLEGCLVPGVSDNFTTPAPLNANGATGTVGIWHVAIGYQLNNEAREAKFTRPPVAPEDSFSSRSAIYLDPLPTTLDGSGNVLSLSAKLLVCRVGSELRLFRASSGQWVEERSLLASDGASQPPNLYLLPPVMSVLPTSYFLSTEGYIRFPLPTPDQNNALQVGVMANSWAPSPDNSVGPETRAEFHYIRFAPIPPSSTDECASLMPVPND